MSRADASMTRPLEMHNRAPHLNACVISAAIAPEQKYTEIYHAVLGSGDGEHDGEGNEETDTEARDAIQ